MLTPSTFSIPQRALAEAGLSIERLCERAGLVPTNAWATKDFFVFGPQADEMLGNRSLGLRFGAEGIKKGHGIASIVALHAPDFRQALAALSRYKQLTCPELVEVELKGGDEATVSYRWLETTSEVPRVLVDTTMASLNELARQGTGGQVAPVRLELARRALDRTLLRRHFDCPVVFEASHDTIVFDRAALDVPFVKHFDSDRSRHKQAVVNFA